MNFSILLNEKHAKLSDEITNIKASLAASKTDMPDPIDNALVQGEINLLRSMLITKQNDLKSIIAAQRRVANGSFGECEECGNPIAEKRLIFNPTFECCVECQSDRSITQKQRSYNLNAITA